MSKVLLFDVQRAGSGRWIGMAEKAPGASGIPQNSKEKNLGIGYCEEILVGVLRICKL